jgi:hypothetical protein
MCEKRREGKYEESKIRDVRRKEEKGFMKRGREEMYEERDV